MITINSGERVAIICEGNGYGWGRQAYTVKGTKRLYVTVMGKKYYLDEIERLEDHVYVAGTRRDGSPAINSNAVFKIEGDK